MAQAPPDLKIPSSSTTVKVRVIDSTSIVDGVPTTAFFAPEIKGYSVFRCPAYSILIEHPSNRSLLFDLGVRKDYLNLAPENVARIKSLGFKVTVKQGVREQLEANGVDAKAIEGVIWSHYHWDHTGDPSTFEKNTALIVGPGFKEAFVPGYPANPESRILESDYEGRELREIAFDQTTKIGRFNAFDYFGDGSFYLLDSPGHAIGHLCALARVTTNPSSFIFMGGDACHHAGQLRPTQYLPLPSSILPNPFDTKSITPCPGSLFDSLYRDGDKNKPFYTVSRPGDGPAVSADPDEAEKTIGKVIEADAHDEILVVLAHDHNLLPVLDFFPKYANDFMQKGWVQEGRWLFLKDFAKAIEH